MPLHAKRATMHRAPRGIDAIACQVVAVAVDRSSKTIWPMAAVKRHAMAMYFTMGSIGPVFHWGGGLNVSRLGLCFPGGARRAASAAAAASPRGHEQWSYVQCNARRSSATSY
jgi:hypothetical protein